MLPCRLPGPSRKAFVLTDRTPSDNAALPTLAQLNETRLKRWHQNGEALLTFENVRSWLNAAGLVLFIPRPQIAAPAPSMVEAVLGATTPAPTLEEMTEARSLLARLIAEGIAVPLNLLGTQGGAMGETPDFVASAAVFSYIFTLRGDKGWKQPPTASGTNKVSQLAVHTYEILAKSGSRTASDLTQELGNAVTEAAVLRALGELWTHLRVLPLPQSDGRATLWELTSARYIKQIKAGANAGQPSALSALISLYLGQVAVATEDDVEVFLSPLAPRSRVRDVVHALTAARQLDAVAIDGRTMVHLNGEAPTVTTSAPEGEAGEQVEGAAVDPEAAQSGLPGNENSEGAESAEGEGAPRIKKFVPKPKKIGTGYLAKGAPSKTAGRTFSRTPERPGRSERPAFGRTDRGDRPASGRSERPGRPAFGRPDRDTRPGAFPGKPDRERRPFQKSRPAADAQSSDAGVQKPRFDRPWSEDRPKRPAGADRGERPSFSGAKQFTGKPRPRRDDSASKGERGNQGWKPAFRSSRPPAREGSREPGARPQRRESGGGFASRGAGPSRFAPGTGAPKRPFRPAEGRPQEGRAEGERPARPFRKFDAPRPGSKPPFAKRREGSGTEERPRRTFSPRPEGGAGRPGRPEGRPREFNSDRKPAKFASKRPGGPRREGGFSAGPRREGGFSARPPRPGGAGGFSARPRKPGTGGDRPFGNKGTSSKGPAKRTFKRKEDESA
jgi:23S rRNA pseudouridine2605 synthase